MVGRCRHDEEVAPLEGAAAERAGSRKEGLFFDVT
jgi:hypothetical protein